MQMQPFLDQSRQAMRYHIIAQMIIEGSGMQSNTLHNKHICV